MESHNRRRNTAEARNVCPFQNCGFLHHHNVSALNRHFSDHQAAENLPEELILPWQMRACRHCNRVVCSRAAVSHQQSCPALQLSANQRSCSSRDNTPAITNFFNRAPSTPMDRLTPSLPAVPSQSEAHLPASPNVSQPTPIDANMSTSQTQTQSCSGDIPPQMRRPAQTTAGSRRRARRPPQAPIPTTNTGISRDTWAGMTAIDATPILKANIIVMDKIPFQFRDNWRMAVSEVNQACTSSDQLVKKGAEIVLAFLPSMLLRAPSVAEWLVSTRVKMGT